MCPARARIISGAKLRMPVYTAAQVSVHDPAPTTREASGAAGLAKLRLRHYSPGVRAARLALDQCSERFDRTQVGHITLRNFSPAHPI